MTGAYLTPTCPVTGRQLLFALEGAVVGRHAGDGGGAGSGGDATVTTGGIVSIAVLAVLVLLILRGIRGHGHADKSGANSAGGPDDGVGGGGD